MNPFCKVKTAVYGALQDGHAGSAQAIDVTSRVQELIDTHAGIVTINNDTMGKDPAFGIVKQFRATVTVNGMDHAFSCAEGQTINFTQAGPADPGQLMDTLKNIMP
jgi:hypothetical protein